jgi:hypothetical protein
VAAFSHHLDRQIDRMTHVAHARHPSGSQVGALHHPRVELNFAFEVEAGADAGIQERLVLQAANGGDRGRQSAVTDQCPSHRQRPFDGGLTEGALGNADRARTTVDDQGRAGHALKECAVSGAGCWLEPALRPGFAALERATLGDPPVEWVKDPSACARAHRIASLGVPALDVRPPSFASTLRSARHQSLENHHVTHFPH